MNFSVENSSKPIQCFLLNAEFMIYSDKPSQSVYTSQVIVSTFTIILIIPTLILNGISVLTILKSSNLKEKVAYTIIMLQSLADLAIGFVSMPVFFYLVMPKISYNFASCIGQLLLLRVMVIPFLLSLLVLTGMTMERYIGVQYPLRHRTLITKKRVIISMCLGGGFIIFTFTPLSFLQTSFTGRFLSTSQVCFLIFSTFVYTKIFITIKQRKIPGNSEDSTRCFNRRTFLKEIKLVKSCFLAVLCFFVCFLTSVLLPYITTSGSFLYKILRPLATLSVLVNSSLNSIIFFWTRPQLRNEALTVAKHICTSLK